MTHKAKFTVEAGYIQRTIVLGTIESATRLPLPEGVSIGATDDLAKLWQRLTLKGGKPEPVRGAVVPPTLSIADLFCGCGGFTQGVSDAVRALGFDPQVVFSADIDKEALSVYRKNFRPDEWHIGSVSDLVDFQWTATPKGAAFK